MDDKKLTLLVRQAIRGDMGAFEEVYFDSARSVLFHVRNQIIDKENYQDVAQDVAIAMWKNIKQLRKPKAFRGWMHQVIRTTCASHNRALLKERERQSIDNSEELIDEMLAKTTEKIDDPALLTTLKDDEHRLFYAIQSLPPAYRDTIVLRYYDDLSYKEIADILEISTSSVGTNILRGTEHLKKILGDEGEELSLTELKAKALQQEKPTDEKKVSIRKGRDMNEKKNGIQTGAAVAGTFAINDESIRESLDTGIQELFSPEMIELYNKKIHLSLMGAQVASAAVAAPIVVGTATNIVITAVTSVMAVLAISIGTYGYTTAGLPDVYPWEAKTITTQIDIQYEGDPRILFTTVDGGSSPYGVVAIAVEDSVVAPASITWSISSAETGGQVLSGEGAEIGAASGLGELAPGEYKANFILTDEQGAQALCYRSFTIEEKAEGVE